MNVKPGKISKKLEIGKEIFNASLHQKMTIEAINSLALEKKNRVLELGHGCCDHLDYLMEQAEELRYFGMEVSEKMLQSALVNNLKFVNASKALFLKYDGERIPYVHNMFDKILSINTIFYWKNPVEYINELYRVLKPGGTCVIAFSDTTFLEQLSVVGGDREIYKFYGLDDVTELLVSCEANIFDVSVKNERVKTKSGNWENKEYHVITLKKKAIPRYLR